MLVVFFSWPLCILSDLVLLGQLAAARYKVNGAGGCGEQGWLYAPVSGVVIGKLSRRGVREGLGPVRTPQSTRSLQSPAP